MTKIISIVSYKFLPAKLGGQKAIAFFYKYFSRHLQLVCIGTKDNAIQEASGYEVLPILSTSALRYINPFYFFTIQKLIKKYEGTHLLIEHPYYGWLALLIKKFCRVSLIVHSHNIEGLRWKALGKWWWKILWRYEKFTHRQADFNLFIQPHDMEYAIREFGLDPLKCMVMTYGIERNAPPSLEEKRVAKETVSTLHGIHMNDRIFLFNGAFDYKPNLEALFALLHSVNPLLASYHGLRYKLIICGRNIPESITEKDFPNLVLAGFVNDINVYLKSTDVFLNAVTEGGGIKTKLVEALGHDCNAVSTVNGALGIDPAICNGKLLLVPDNDWKSFSEKAVQAVSIPNKMSEAYYEYFYADNVAKKAAAFIETIRLHKKT